MSDGIADTSPAVTVVIAAYNAAGCIATALNSTLNDQIPDVEVIVVDDASTDGTADVVEAIAATEPRLQLIRMPQNGGPGHARNVAMEVARGRWIAVLDADDTYLPGRLQSLLKVADDWSADMVADNLAMVDGTSGRIFDNMLDLNRLPKPTLITPTTFVRGSRPKDVKRKLGLLKPLFKRAFLDRHGIGYNEEVYVGEDFLFALDCLIAGARFVLIPDALYAYTISRGSLSQSRSLSQAELFLKHCDDLLNRPEVVANPDLRLAISERSRELHTDAQYLRFAITLKKGQLLAAMRVSLDNPIVFRHILLQSMRVARLRLRQLNVGNRLAAPLQRDPLVNSRGDLKP